MRTLAKLDQVMPPRLRAEVRAIRDATEVVGPFGSADQVDGDALLGLARACRDRVRVRFGYRTRRGDEAERTVEPVRLVSTGRRWYLMAFDVDRDDWRTFRLDRMEAVAPTTWGFRPREHPDPVEFVRRGVAHDAWTHRAKVQFACAGEVLREQTPAIASLVEDDGPSRCLLQISGDDLGWMTAQLATLGHEFTVLEPAELVDEVRRTAERLSRAIADH